MNLFISSEYTSRSTENSLFDQTKAKATPTRQTLPFGLPAKGEMPDYKQKPEFSGPIITGSTQDDDRYSVKTDAHRKLEKKASDQLSDKLIDLRKRSDCKSSPRSSPQRLILKEMYADATSPVRTDTTKKETNPSAKSFKELPNPKNDVNKNVESEDLKKGTRSPYMRVEDNVNEISTLPRDFELNASLENLLISGAKSYIREGIQPAKLEIDDQILEKLARQCFKSEEKKITFLKLPEAFDEAVATLLALEKIGGNLGLKLDPTAIDRSSTKSISCDYVADTEFLTESDRVKFQIGFDPFMMPRLIVSENDTSTEYVNLFEVKRVLSELAEKISAERGTSTKEHHKNAVKRWRGKEASQSQAYKGSPKVISMKPDPNNDLGVTEIETNLHSEHVKMLALVEQLNDSNLEGSLTEDEKIYKKLTPIVIENLFRWADTFKKHACQGKNGADLPIVSGVLDMGVVPSKEIGETFYEHMVEEMKSAGYWNDKQDTLTMAAIYRTRPAKNEESKESEPPEVVIKMVAPAPEKVRQLVATHQVNQQDMGMGNLFSD
ncbi:MULTISPECIES: hypothetical protein [unclassified Caballeronia]|uniref:hypothetical protein n=1 Tax=unclassified Caballeronia TaxID=2646786 RepID=UPI002029136C|nr:MULTISPECIES: hypothetical protein [unclassified Caballeronia]